MQYIIMSVVDIFYKIRLSVVQVISAPQIVKIYCLVTVAVLAQKFWGGIAPISPFIKASPFFFRSPKPKTIRTSYRPTFEIYHY